MRHNFLILHNIDDLKATRKSHLDHLMFFERYVPEEHNYHYHYVREPVTDALRKINFHVIIISTTALAFCRYYRDREVFRRFSRAWSFVSNSDAIKLAFPQDDYHRSNDIDALLAAWGIDIIYTVRPEYGDLFYPLSGRSSQLKSVYSGYVDDDSIKSTAGYRKSFEDREFDIVQRVTMHPAWGGRFSQIKGNMARAFADFCESNGGVKANISTRPEDALTGNGWMALLGNGRFALGSEGGCSLWDPDGIFLDRSVAYLQDNPDASFGDVEAACFPGEDGKHVFTGFTPRLFEYATMGCSPILTEGEYRGLLQPWEHYIPVKQDLSDVTDAIEATKDINAAKRRIRACHDALIENPSLRYSALARAVTDDVYRLAAGRGFRETKPFDYCYAIAGHRTGQRDLVPLFPPPFRPPTTPLRAALYGLVDKLPIRFRKKVPSLVRLLVRSILSDKT